MPVGWAARFRRSPMARLLALLVALLAVGPSMAAAGGLDAIHRKGEIAIGVKPDYRPWGFVENGGLVGLEPDLARDLARRLEVEPKLVMARSKERIDLLERGMVDVMIATLSETPQRQARLGIVYPAYYESGRNVLVSRAQKVKQWQDLQGKRVCARDGAYYNDAVRTGYKADLRMFVDSTTGMQAMRDGLCWAWLTDDVVIQTELQERPEQWAGFEMPLHSEDVRPWVLAVAKPFEKDPLARAAARTVGDWHRSGWLIERHRYWVKRESPFLDAMHAAWTERAGAGWLCDADSERLLPPRCRSASDLPTPRAGK